MSSSDSAYSDPSLDIQLCQCWLISSLIIVNRVLAFYRLRVRVSLLPITSVTSPLFRRIALCFFAFHSAHCPKLAQRLGSQPPLEP